MSDPFRALALATQVPQVNGRIGLPVLLWGPPGIGKSTRIADMAAALRRHLETVISSLRDPSDFAGLPVPDTTAGAVSMSPPAWARRLAAAKFAILFLDEISTCTPATQAALLRVILDGVVGDLTLPPEVAIVAAANPTDQAAGGWELAPPLANRFIHLELAGADHDGFTGWLMGGGKSNVAYPALDRAAYDEAWRKARALGSAYLGRAKKEDLLVLPKDESSASRAWPSPRSWTAGLAGWAAGVAVKEEDLGADLLMGAVGGASGAFLTWVKEQDLPDPRDVLKNPSLFTVERARLDRTMAILNSVAGEALEGKTNDRAAYLEAGFGVVEKALAAGFPDVVVPAGKLLAAKAPSTRNNSPVRGATETRVLSTLLPYLSAAGLARA